MKIKSILLLLSISPIINAQITSINLNFTEQGYWYAKGYNNDPCFPENINWEACNDYRYFDNAAEMHCFFEGTLRKNHPVLHKLKFWNYIKTHNLIIENKEQESIEKELKILQKYFSRYKNLFEKIAKFYGVTKKINLNIFYSRVSKNFNYASAICLDNFIYGNTVNTLFLISEPPLNNNLSMASRISIIAHEFSHAMLDLAFGGREEFENKVIQTKEPNAKIVSWILNEALAAILGNIIVQEEISGKKVDWEKEEYCTYGFANALHDLTKEYLNSSKTIDTEYIKKAIKIFNEMFPKSYCDSRFFLRRFYLITTDDEFKNQSILFKKTNSDQFDVLSLDKDNFSKNEIESIKNSPYNIVFVYSSAEQLRIMKKFLPNLNMNNHSNVIHDNNKTYIIIKIDTKNNFQQKIDELFEKYKK